MSNSKVLFLQILFKGELPIRMCSAGHDVLVAVTGGVTENWRFVGDALKISNINLNSTLDDKSATIVLDAKNNYINSLKLNRFICAFVSLFVLEFDGSGNVLSRKTLAIDTMRKPSVIKTAKKSEIKITLNNMYIDLKRKRGFSAVDGAHRLRPSNSTDNIFQYSDQYGAFK